MTTLTRSQSLPDELKAIAERHEHQRAMGKEFSWDEYRANVCWNDRAALLAIIPDVERKAREEERERCAKIVDAVKPHGGRMWSDEQRACFEALDHAATAIRNGKTP